MVGRKKSVFVLMDRGRDLTAVALGALLWRHVRSTPLKLPLYPWKSTNVDTSTVFGAALTLAASGTGACTDGANSS